jgi:hypothetical protein
LFLFEHAQNSPEVTKPCQPLTTTTKTTKTTMKKKKTTTTTTTKCLLLLLAPAVPAPLQLVNQQPLMMSTPFLKQWGERR